MNSFSDQSILILGLGASGLSMARWCARMGARVWVADTRETPPQLGALRRDVPSAQFLTGLLSADLLASSGAGAVFKSPGLTPAQCEPVLAAARRANIRTGGEIDLFQQALGQLRGECNYQPKVLAISGTNGKTTVTSLTGKLVERCGLSVAVAGNIGPALLDTLSAHIDSDSLPQVWVLELSSFQLETTTSFEPTAATVLNVTQDHLDWHEDMAHYQRAKARVFGETGQMILNRDDASVMAMLPAPAKGKAARQCLSFGTGLPQRAGDFGLEVLNGMTWLVRAHEADETQRRRKAIDEELHIQRLMPADALRIRGRHNATNALAALALAQAAGGGLAQMLYGLRDYKGEPHRVESVAVVGDVEYFDDSKGTNVGATVAALQGLGTERKIVVILGGDGKGQDFAPLKIPVGRFARAVVLMGKDSPYIRTALAGAGVDLHQAATLAEAVSIASQLAQVGDAVLMSPACASFDMFRDYQHRAQVFCDAVHEMAARRGEVQ